MGLFVNLCDNGFQGTKTVHKTPTLKSKRGFTIIEVLIVLAIAGLLILLVFLAVPAIQRTARNYQRKSVATAVLAELNNYFATSSKRGWPAEPPFDLYGDETDMCKVMQQAVAGAVGNISSCDYDVDNGGSPSMHCQARGESDKGWTVCWQGIDHTEDPDMHDYKGAYDVIGIAPGHWCVTDSTPGHGGDMGPLTSDTAGKSYKVISVVTKLEKDMPFCLDSGAQVD